MWALLMGPALLCPAGSPGSDADAPTGGLDPGGALTRSQELGDAAENKPGWAW